MIAKAGGAVEIEGKREEGFLRVPTFSPVSGSVAVRQVDKI